MSKCEDLFNSGDVAEAASAGASFCAGFPPSSSGGSIPSPPGLPLTDPPRVTGAVPAYDPDFGFALRGIAFDHQIPAAPPPPAGNVGVSGQQQPPL